MSEEVANTCFTCDIHVNHDDLITIQRQLVLFYIHPLPEMINLRLHNRRNLLNTRQFLKRRATHCNALQLIDAVGVGFSEATCQAELDVLEGHFLFGVFCGLVL